MRYWKERWHSNFYRWLKQNNFPEGFRVLCINCNFSLGIYGYCPHEKQKTIGMNEQNLIGREVN